HGDGSVSGACLRWRKGDADVAFSSGVQRSRTIIALGKIAAGSDAADGETCSATVGKRDALSGAGSANLLAAEGEAARRKCYRGGSAAGGHGDIGAGFE